MLLFLDFWTIFSYLLQDGSEKSAIIILWVCSSVLPMSDPVCAMLATAGPNEALIAFYMNAEFYGNSHSDGMSTCVLLIFVQHLYYTLGMLSREDACVLLREASPSVPCKFWLSSFDVTSWTITIF